MWRIDPAPAFRAFARHCALDVAHLWDCPWVTLRYLKEGREEDREEARDTALFALENSSVAADAAWTTIWAAIWAANKDMFDAAHFAVRRTISSLSKTHSSKEALEKHYDQLLEGMVEELHQNPTKTWTF